MNPEHQEQLKSFYKKVDDCMADLKQHVEDSDSDVKSVASDVLVLKEVVFGNEKTKEKGMKEKVDEMHEILVQLKGIKGLFGIILLIGATIITLKTWLK